MRAPWGSLQEIGFGPSQTREYKAAWARARRLSDPRFAERQRENVRVYRKTKGRERFKRYKQNWIKKNPEKHKAYFRRRWRESRRCFGCRKYKKGRWMQKVERLALIDGKFQKITVLWCGRC